MPINPELVFGSLIVCVYAYDRFNSETAIRVSTTRLRYHGAFFFYAAMVFLLFLMFAVSPNILGLLPGLQPLRGTLADLSAPLAAALVLTALLPRMVELKRIDEWLLARFHNLADYPNEVRRLRKLLLDAPFEAPEDMRASVRQELEGQKLDPDDPRFKVSPSAHASWRRLVALRLIVDGWKEDGRHNRILEALHEEVEGFEKRYNSLATRAHICLSLIGRPSGPLDPTAAAAVGDSTSSFLSSLKALSALAHELIARGALHRSWTIRSVELACNGLGFKVHRPVISHHQISTLAIVLFALQTLGVLVRAAAGPQQPVDMRLWLALMITVNFSLAVAVVTVEKGRWAGFASRAADGSRPATFYLAATASTIALCAVARSGFAATGSGLLGMPLAPLWEAWPWLTLPGVMAFATAFNLDNAPRERLRWIEGLGQAAALAATALLVRTLVLPGVSEERWGQYSTWSVVRVVALSGLSGFVVGFWVPTWQRMARVLPQLPEPPTMRLSR